MTEWREATLGEVLTLQRGFDITKKEQRAGRVPVVSSSGIGSYHDEAKVDAPGVVIGRKGSLGTAFYLEEPFWPHDTTLWVKDFKGNDPYFCHLLLRGLPLAELDGGAANPTLNRNHAHTLKVRVPTPAVQRRIGAMLAAFDELIAINERRIELLEDLARSLYSEWFLRRPQPQEWIRTTVESVCDVIRGRSYKRSELSDLDGVPFLNLKCVARGGGFRPEGAKRYTGRFSESQRVVAGETLIAVTDMTQERRIVGQAFRMPNMGEQYAVPSLDLTVVRPRDVELRTYIYTVLRYSDFSERVRQYANGVNVLHLAVERILEAPIVLPDSETVARFSAAIEPVLTRAEACHVENRKLADTRELLLPRLVSGRLDISAIDLGDLLTEDAA